MNFEALVTALTVSENKTVAGMQQQFFNGPTYESLHHFTSNSQWSVENLREMRLRYVIAKLIDAIKFPDPLSSCKAPLPIGTIHRLENTIEELSNERFLPMVRESEGRWPAAEQEHQLLQCLSQLPKNKVGFRLIAAIDATFIHHAGERIYIASQSFFVPLRGAGPYRSVHLELELILASVKDSAQLDLPKSSI